MDLLQKIAEESARLAGHSLLSLQATAKIRQKGPRDLVTEADLEAQRVIRETIVSHFPTHGFLGEECSPDDRARASQSEHVWVVDPLDGTTNYVHGLPLFCVSIALLRQGRPIVGVIYDPVHHQMFSATAGRGAYENGQRMGVSSSTGIGAALVSASFAADVSYDSQDVQGFLKILPHARAVRRLGSTALNMAYVAAGRLDAYWSWSCKIWDVAAGVLLIQEAGGLVTDWKGNAPNLLADARVLSAATPTLHAELMQLLGNPNQE